MKMESIRDRMLRNKRGQTIELIGSTVISLMVLIFLIFAVLYGIAALNPSTFFSAGSNNANAVGNLTSNLTAGVSNFGAYIPTIFTVLAVVLVLSAIVILILYVRRMQAGAGSSGVGL